LTATNSITAPSCTTESAPTLGLNGTATITGSMDGLRYQMKMFSSSSSAARDRRGTRRVEIAARPATATATATAPGRRCGGCTRTKG
jgi:hypothetical protein